MSRLQRPGLGKRTHFLSQFGHNKGAPHDLLLCTCTPRNVQSEFGCAVEGAEGEAREEAALWAGRGTRAVPRV
jgi:hypothetical protein